jgi:hypothetical protein
MSPDVNGLRVLYVIGTGRSGSTIFGAAAGMHAGAVAAGELNRLAHEKDPFRNRKCSCGDFLNACPFWSEVWRLWEPAFRDTSFQRYQQLLERYERLRSYPLLLKELRQPSEDFQIYQRLNRKLHQAIAQVSGAEVIVDTSKYAVRGLALSRMEGLHVRMVHLIRDGRGVFWSLKKAALRHRRKIKRLRARAWTWMAPFEWIVLNAIAEAITRSVPHIQVRYEHFVASPERIMNELGALVGLDMRKVGQDLSSGVPVTFDHMVGGNYVRMGGPIALKIDEAWKRELPSFERSYFWAVAGFRARAYGYERGRAKLEP